MARTITPLRLLSVWCLWAAMAFLHARTAGPDVLPTAVLAAAGLGLSVLLLSHGERSWASVLTAVVLFGTSPVLQGMWTLLNEQRATDPVNYLKVLVMLGGLQAMFFLDSDPEETEEAEEAQAEGDGQDLLRGEQA